MGEIRIYVEGGGRGKETKAAMRRGFGGFLSQLRDSARERNIRWNIIACGPRNAAIDNFFIAIRSHAQAFNLLLVDAEAPVTSAPWKHLERHGENAPDEQCHLMVQMMEAWFVADCDALANFYGSGFRAGALPTGRNVELIEKDRLESALLMPRATHKKVVTTRYAMVRSC